MSEQPIWVTPETDVITAAARMSEHGLGALAVCEHGRLVGIITDRDIVFRYLMSRSHEGRLVAHYMTRGPITVEPEESVERAQALMSQHHIRRLPVCEHGRLVGMVAQGDLARCTTGLEVVDVGSAAADRLKTLVQMAGATAKRIVVGVDGSDGADRALEWAVSQARLTSARLELVTAWHVPFLAYGIGVAPPLVSGVDVGFSEVAEEVAAVAIAKARGAGIEAESTIRHGQPADILIEEAKSADLLVVGSRGHGGFAGLLLGSVSAQCAHHSPCALVIVR